MLKSSGVVNSEELLQVEYELTQQMAVSIHAIEGVQDSQTITLTGNKGKKQFSILIDGGSTHSFIDDKTAIHLKCELTKTPPMKVLVANGNQLISQYECNKFSWQIGNHHFQTSVKTLPMGSYDLVLGVDWLGSLGPVTFDFKQLQMQFQHQGQVITLQGNQKPGKPRLQQMTVAQFVRSCQRQEHGLMFLLDVVEKPTGSLLSQQMIEGAEMSKECIKFQGLLEEYDDIFQTPTGLPPQRDIEHSIEHSIELKDGSQPFSMRPYRN